MLTATVLETQTNEAVVKTDDVEQLAQQLAQQHIHARAGKAAYSLLKRLETEAKLLHSAYEYFGKASRQDLNLSYEAEWVLDNFYLVQQTVRQIGGIPQQLVSFGTDEAGHIYAVGYEGMIYQLDFTEARFEDAKPNVAEKGSH